jgi:hypothetical protein
MDVRPLLPIGIGGRVIVVFDGGDEERSWPSGGSQGEPVKLLAYRPEMAWVGSGLRHGTMLYLMLCSRFAAANSSTANHGLGYPFAAPNPSS